MVNSDFNISQIIKRRRESLGITQDHMAKYLGYRNRSSIALLEGEYREWRWRDVIKACKLLGLEIEIK